MVTENVSNNAEACREKPNKWDETYKVDLGIELTIYNIWGEHANYYTTYAVQSRMENPETPLKKHGMNPIPVSYKTPVVLLIQ